MYLENLFNNAQSCLEDAAETWWGWRIQCHWKVRNYFLLLQSFSQRTGIWRKKAHASKCFNFFGAKALYSAVNVHNTPLTVLQWQLFVSALRSFYLSKSTINPSRLFQKIWHRFLVKSHMSFKLREKCSVKSF